ncbi:hypothetical protein, partial [Microcystis sp. LEGE 08355]|uniref:hypothetical protein n=1 Tax=Microcystis sp. LEGE 08355 TaxID=1828687 RepID=UPI001D139863
LCVNISAMYTGLGKLSIQSEKWRSGVVMFLNVKFCYEIQHFWTVAYKVTRFCEQLLTSNFPRSHAGSGFSIPVTEWLTTAPIFL